MGIPVEAISAGMGALFGAGMAYGAMRITQTKQAADLNGIGRKMGRLMAE